MYGGAPGVTPLKRTNRIQSYSVGLPLGFKGALWVTIPFIQKIPGIQTSWCFFWGRIWYVSFFSPNEDLQCKNTQTCKVQVVTFNQQNSCNPSFRFGMRSAALSRSKAELHLIGTAMAPASPSSYSICNLDILKVMPQTCAAIGSIAVGQVYDASEGRSILIMYEWDATAREIYNFCCAFSRLMIRWCDLTCGLLMRIVWPLPRTLHWRRFAVGRKLLIVQ